MTRRYPDGSGFILDPLDGDDAIFMPLKHLVAGDPVAGDTVSYDVGPLQGVTYNVKAVVPEPCPLLQRSTAPLSTRCGGCTKFEPKWLRTWPSWV